MEAKIHKRLYRLTCEKWGIVTLREKRLKFSRFDECNDPFELLSAHLKDRDARRFYKELSAAVSERFGLLCFSETWRSPVMWAHYADKHKGLCLGFDVKEAAKVDYRPERLKHVVDEAKSGACTVADLTKIALVTKFKEWEYEREWRCFHDLKDESPDLDGNHFHTFDDQIALREVLIGHRCELTTEQIAEIIGTPEYDVHIIRARAAFQKFEVVRQKSIAVHIVKGTRPST